MIFLELVKPLGPTFRAGSAVENRLRRPNGRLHRKKKHAEKRGIIDDGRNLTENYSNLSKNYAANNSPCGDRVSPPEEDCGPPGVYDTEVLLGETLPDCHLQPIAHFGRRLCA